MPGGTPLDNLVDIFRTTGPAIVTGADEVLNEAQFRKTLLRMMIRGKDMQEMVRGGESIRDIIYFDERSSYQHYQPNEIFAPENPQLATQFSVPWRFTKVDVSFYKQELGLNFGDLTGRAKHHMFKRLIRIKMQNMWTALSNGMERDLFVAPNNAQMEATGGILPYSLPCTIHTFGAVSTDTDPTATVPPGFTTIQQINPTTQTKWRNPVEFYTGGDVDNWNGFKAFRKMFLRLDFENLVWHPEMGNADMPDGMILCSKVGFQMVEGNVRRGNDTFRGGKNFSDPAYPGINFDGVPYVYVQKLDTAEIWPGGGGTTFAGEFDGSLSESGAALANPDIEGPRFIWIRPKYYYKVIHSDNFLVEEAVTPPFQPFSRIIYYDCWHNNLCRSRQRGGGVVAPSADVLITAT